MAKKSLGSKPLLKKNRQGEPVKHMEVGNMSTGISSKVHPKDYQLDELRPSKLYGVMTEWQAKADEASIMSMPDNSTGSIVMDDGSVLSVKDYKAKVAAAAGAINKVDPKAEAGMTKHTEAIKTEGAKSVEDGKKNFKNVFGFEIPKGIGGINIDLTSKDFTPEQIKAIIASGLKASTNGKLEKTHIKGTSKKGAKITINDKKDWTSIEPGTPTTPLAMPGRQAIQYKGKTLYPVGTTGTGVFKVGTGDLDPEYALDAIFEDLNWSTKRTKRLSHDYNNELGKSDYDKYSFNDLHNPSKLTDYSLNDKWVDSYEGEMSSEEKKSQLASLARSNAEEERKSPIVQHKGLNEDYPTLTVRNVPEFERGQIYKALSNIENIIGSGSWRSVFPKEYKEIFGTESMEGWDQKGLQHKLNRINKSKRLKSIGAKFTKEKLSEDEDAAILSNYEKVADYYRGIISQFEQEDLDKEISKSFAQKTRQQNVAPGLAAETEQYAGISDKNDDTSKKVSENFNTDVGGIDSKFYTRNVRWYSPGIARPILPVKFGELNKNALRFNSGSNDHLIPLTTSDSGLNEAILSGILPTVSKDYKPLITSPEGLKNAFAEFNAKKQEKEAKKSAKAEEAKKSANLVQAAQAQANAAKQWLTANPGKTMADFLDYKREEWEKGK